MRHTFSGAPVARPLPKPGRLAPRSPHVVRIVAQAKGFGASDASVPASSTLAAKVGTAAAVATVLVTAQALLPLSYGSGGPGGGGGGSGGGGGGGGFFEPLLVARADEAEDEDEDDEDEDEEDVGAEDDGDDEDDEDVDSDTDASTDSGRPVADDEGSAIGAVKDESEFMEPPAGIERSAFYCVEVKAEGLPQGHGIPTEDDLFASLNCQPGFWVPRKKLQEDLKSLIGMGIFKEVDVKVVPVNKESKSKRMRAVFTFQETFFPPIKSFEITNSKCLPPDMKERVMAAVKKHHDQQPTGLAVLTTIRNEIDNWYGDRGFVYSTIKEFDGLETGNIRMSVVEPKIRSIAVKFVDENMQERPEGGQTPVEVVRRCMTLRPGQFYSLHDGRMALQQAFTLQVFENAQVLPEFAPSSDDLLDITVMVKERPMQTMDMDLEWGLAPWVPRLPVPLPVTPVPGGSLTYEDRNFHGNGDNLSASLMCSNFVHPTDDLSVRASYRRPYVFGKEHNEDLVVDAFNARRLSSVFAGGPAMDVPPVWIERAGVKFALAKNLSRHSKSSVAVVGQEIKTRDDTGALIAAGQRTGSHGELVDAGPPTTLSGTGVDRAIDLKFSLTRDTTFAVNGALVGSRDVAEVNQGLGLGNGIFNRYMVSLTRFLKLNTPSAASALPPVTLVLHGKHGNCIGPIGSYDYHVLGGPHSCRAYSLGELGAARNFVEAAAELRLPVPLLNTQAYAFAEHARDLGSGDDLVGKPREFYNKLGQGSALGLGVRLGAMRAELSRDCNKGTSTWFVFFGERF